jgi:hypothetical protein
MKKILDAILAIRYTILWDFIVVVLVVRVLFLQAVLVCWLPYDNVTCRCQGNPSVPLSPSPSPTRGEGSQTGGEP